MKRGVDISRNPGGELRAAAPKGQRLLTTRHPIHRVCNDMSECGGFVTLADAEGFDAQELVRADG